MSDAFCATYGQEASFLTVREVKDVEHRLFYASASMAGMLKASTCYNVDTMGTLIPPRRDKPRYLLDSVFFRREFCEIARAYLDQDDGFKNKFFFVQIAPEICLAVRYRVAPTEEFYLQGRARDLFTWPILGYGTQMALYTMLQGPGVGPSATCDLLARMPDKPSRMAWFQAHTRLCDILPANWKYHNVEVLFADDRPSFLSDDDSLDEETETCFYVRMIDENTGECVFPVPN